MNRIRIYLFIFFNFIAFDFFSQLSFQKTFGSALNENGFSTLETNDGGFIICGSQMLDSLNSNIYIIRTNFQGDTLWIKNYGGPNADFGQHIEQTNDGGFIVAGITTSFGAGHSDAYLLKLNASGDSIWTRSYGGIGSDLSHSVKQTKDGGFILSGHTDSYGTKGDFYLLKILPNGDTSWTRTYGGIKHDHAYSVKQTSDSGYIVAGHSLSFGSSGGFYVVKTNAIGDTLWTKGYGGNGNSFCYSIEQTYDGGYIIGGETECFGSGPSDFLIIKINSVGDTLWSKTYGGIGSEFLNQVKQTPDGGFILIGYTDSFGAGSTDVYLIKINSIGEVLWSKAFGGTNDDEGNFVNLTSDGGYIITGSTKSFGSGGFDVYLIKTDSLGNTFCHQTDVFVPAEKTSVSIFNINTKVSSTSSRVNNTNTTTNFGISSIYNTCSSTDLDSFITIKTGLKIYPNPANNYITIDFGNKPSTITLYDLFGNLVSTFEPTQPIYIINLRSLSEGVYFLNVGGQYSKVIKHHNN